MALDQREHEDRLLGGAGTRPRPSEETVGTSNDSRGRDGHATHRLFAGLNPAQVAAVRHGEGPLLIHAGAGSGKTRVLTHRLAYLIETGAVSPREILAVTFTNKAAAEMRSRLVTLIGADRARRIMAGTFHGLCVRLLRQELAGTRRGRFSIVDQDDSILVLKGVLAAMGIDKGEIGPLCKEYRARISDYKNDLLLPEDLDEPDGPKDAQFRAAFVGYERALLRLNGFDFDDLILRMVRHLRAHPDRERALATRFRQVTVDEFQDTSPSQDELVRRLSSVHHNLCVVGDGDQGIYSWRKADLQNILTFAETHRGAASIALEQNYRSSKTIVEAAAAVVSLNTHRLPKRLWTENQAGGPITVVRVADQDEEADYIVSEVERLRATGRRYKDCACLYRTNAQSRAIENACLRAGVPYVLVGGVRFYDRREVKDVMAYLRVLSNPDDDISFARIANVPSRKMGAAVMARLAEAARAAGVSLRVALGQGLHADFPTGPRRACAALAALFNDLDVAAAIMPAPDLVDDVIDHTGYALMLEGKGDDGDDRLRNVREIITAAEVYNTMPPREGLRAFLEQVALIADVDTLDAKGPDADTLTLMTLHAAKGLEFPVVFMAGLEDYIFPHLRSFDSEETGEEERRLAYVGITRARELLYLISAAGRMLWGTWVQNPPSRYISDIPRALCRLVGGYGRRGDDPWAMRDENAAWEASPGGARGFAGWTGSVPRGTPDPYEVLEVTTESDVRTCERAYRRLSRKGGHPDTGGSHERAVLLARAIEWVRRQAAA